MASIRTAVLQDAELSALYASGLLKVETVDGIQGGEADYVILSMVRCSTNSNLNFLAQKNRLCVALSRAKQLLLIVGNTRTFKTSGCDLLKSLLKVLPFIAFPSMCLLAH